MRQRLVIDPEMAPHESADALAAAGMTQAGMAAFLGVTDRTGRLVIDREMAPHEFADALAAAGMTQAGMAAFLGVTDRTVRRYLTGTAAIPASTAILLRVMAHCNLHICVLVA